MTAPFRLYGATHSPFAAKVRAYLTFKGLDFEWLERTQARQEEFARYAKLPLAPVLVDAENSALQDSTPMIEAIERAYPEPSIIPEDPGVAFLAALIEDYSDEWLSKAMFHYRWSYPDDQAVAARRVVEALFEGAPAPDGVEEAVRSRMAGRLHHAGSSPEAAPAIEGSFTRLLESLERHLDGRAYLFGGRPSLADFGLIGQLRQLAADPTPSAIMRERAPRVAAWIMREPAVEGPWESFDALAPTLAPLLEHEIAEAYLVWMSANANAVAEDAAGVAVEVNGAPFQQKPQRYAAKAFGEIRRKRADVSDHEALAALLGETGCDVALEPPTGGAPEADIDDEGEDDEGEES